MRYIDLVCTRKSAQQARGEQVNNDRRMQCLARVRIPTSDRMPRRTLEQGKISPLVCARSTTKRPSFAAYGSTKIVTATRKTKTHQGLDLATDKFLTTTTFVTSNYKYDEYLALVVCV